jgi:hypothetical protein
MNSRGRALALVVAIGIGVGGACAQGQPRQRPLETTPVATGSGTIASERSQLQGRWTLMSLSVTTEKGEKADIEATGVMTFDAFGNLNIEYRLTEASRKTLEGLGIKTPGLVLSTSGSVAIDPRARQIRYVAEGAQEKAAFDADLAARRANPFTADRVRYYQLMPDGLLLLATHHDDGKDAAVARWKRES